LDRQVLVEILDSQAKQVLLDSLVLLGYLDPRGHLVKLEKLVQWEAADLMDCQAILDLQVTCLFYFILFVC